MADSRLGHRLADVLVHPATPASRAGTVSIPKLDDQGVRVDVPDDGGAQGPAPAPADTGATSCDAPMSMTKVTSGAFHGKLTLNAYYPDLVGQGFLQHPGVAGPFDSGEWVGSNVQLFGTFPSPCRPDLFSLAQTVTMTRDRRDGVTDPDEGKGWDDIAASHRDASKAPFRQDFLGDGYNVSMADPPSTKYGPTTDVELDRDFETSLIGPKGRATVTWSTSIRVEKGKVTRNTVS